MVTIVTGEIGPQMKDFLCGCEYCVTVDTGEPLDITDHMMRCHGWREGMKKTMEMMNQTPVPVVTIDDRQDPPVAKGEAIVDDIASLYMDYKWRNHELYGWSYMTTDQELFHKDQWIYLEDLKWVWSMTGNKNLLYSYRHGWLYNTLYQSRRIIYWYDKRIWELPK